MVQIRSVSVQKTLGDTGGFLGLAQTLQFYLWLTRKQRNSEQHTGGHQNHPRNCLQWRFLAASPEMLIQKFEGGPKNLYFNNHYTWVRRRWSPLLETSNGWEIRYLRWPSTPAFCMFAKISKLLINKTALLIRKLRNSVVKSVTQYLPSTCGMSQGQEKKKKSKSKTKHNPLRLFTPPLPPHSKS